MGIHEVGKGCWKKPKVVSWKVRNEIGKNEVRKSEPKLEFFATALKTFQLRLVLSNFNGNLLTSDFPT